MICITLLNVIVVSSNKKVSTLPDDVVEAALEAGVRSVNLSKNLFAEVPHK